MTEKEFIRLLAKKAGITITDARMILSALVEVINTCVQDREPFTILNLGTLGFTKVKARRVKGNPNFLDGADREYPEAEKVFFHLSNGLKKLMKNSKKQEEVS